MDELETQEPIEAAFAADEVMALRERLAEQEGRERAAIARLRQALLASDPAIDAELVTGETLEEVEQSFATARSLVDRIREAVRWEQAGAVPAGAAVRTVRVPQSAIEKIRAGLGGR